MGFVVNRVSLMKSVIQVKCNIVLKINHFYMLKRGVSTSRSQFFFSCFSCIRILDYQMMQFASKRLQKLLARRHFAQIYCFGRQKIFDFFLAWHSSEI